MGTLEESLSLLLLRRHKLIKDRLAEVELIEATSIIEEVNQKRKEWQTLI